MPGTKLQKGSIFCSSSWSCSPSLSPAMLSLASSILILLNILFSWISSTQAGAGMVVVSCTLVVVVVSLVVGMGGGGGGIVGLLSPLLSSQIVLRQMTSIDSRKTVITIMAPAIRDSRESRLTLNCRCSELMVTLTTTGIIREGYK